LPGIGPPGYMNRHGMFREHIWHACIRQPAVIGRAGFLQRLPRSVGIAHAVYVGAQTQGTSRAQQKVPEFLAAFLIPPIADPYHPPPIGCVGWRRMKQSDVGGFVPDKTAVAPPRSAVYIRQR